MSQTDFATPERYPRFERWWSRLILAVEIAVAVNIVAGLLGLFGTGPLSTATYHVAYPLMDVAYERITRRSVQSEILVEYTGELPGRRLEVELPRAFARAFEVISTSPPALDTRAERDGNVYAFGFGSSGTGEIRFSIKPRGAAIVDTNMKIGDAHVPLRQIVLP